MNSCATTVATTPGTMNPGRPVDSATNTTAAIGTRYPAPRNAAAPTSGNNVTDVTPATPATSRPTIDPWTTRGMNVPPAPPPVIVAVVASARKTNSAATSPRATDGCSTQARTSYPGRSTAACRTTRP